MHTTSAFAAALTAFVVWTIPSPSKGCLPSSLYTFSRSKPANLARYYHFRLHRLWQGIIQPLPAEQPTWARRATRLLYPAMKCEYTPPELAKSIIPSEGR